MVDFTKGQLQKALPRSVNIRITEDMVDKLNGLMQDPELRENFKENLLSYAGVLADGKYKLADYINAVRYVSYKMLGSSNQEAYSRTFPERIKRLTDEGANSKTISSYVAAYNKNQLVNKVLEQTLVPTHILNAHIHQQAINVQADLMLNARSEKVRSDAANSLMNHLKPPETKKLELDMGIKEDKTIDALRQSTMALVDMQRQLIENQKLTAKDTAEQKLIIEGEFEEVENGE